MQYWKQSFLISICKTEILIAKLTVWSVKVQFGKILIVKTYSIDILFYVSMHLYIDMDQNDSDERLKYNQDFVYIF